MLFRAPEVYPSLRKSAGRLSRNARTPSTYSSPAPGLALEIALEVELGVEIGASRSGERALDEAERMGRAACEALGDDARLSHEIFVVDGAIDHARGLSLLGADRLGQHHERPGARIANEAGQDERAAGVGNEADAHEGLEELSRLRREHDVAGERDIGARPRRRTVDRADRPAWASCESRG